MKVILLVFIIVVISSCALRPRITTASSIIPPPLPKVKWTKEDRKIGALFFIGGIGFCVYLNPNYPY